MKIVTVCIWLITLPAACMASQPDPYEEMFDDVEQDHDYLDLINQLDTILKQPINLLEADLEEVRRLPWVSPWLASEIIALRQRGELESVDDLRKIDGIDDRLVELLRPFVVVQLPRKGPKPATGLLRLRAVSSPASSSCKKIKTYLRAEIEYGGYSAGLVVEKDRDEARLNDFQSFYLERGFRRAAIIVGNFVMASGHGLVFSNPYGYSPSTVEPWRFGEGDFRLRPYTSVDENLMLTGVGLSVSHRSFDFCFAACRNNIDAGLDEEGRVKAISLSGSHVTEGEIRGEDALREDLIGMAARYGRENLRFTMDLLYSRCNREFSHERLTWISEEGNFTGSLDLSLEGEDGMLFMQGAASDGGQALLGGLALNQRPLEFLVLGRKYDPGFLSLHSRPFAFYSGVATGEEGLLFRLAFRRGPRGSISVGNDLHKRRSAGGVGDPTGSESFLECSITLGDFIFTLAEKLLRSKEPPAGEEQATDEKSRLRSRLDVKYEQSSSLWLRMRYEHLHAEHEEYIASERSWSDLIRLDVGVEVADRITLKTGFYVFTVGDYDSRLYQYEPGVPYYPEIEMLKSDGSRWYTVLSLRKESLGTFAAKFGRTIYSGEDDRNEVLLYYSLRR